jgi:hypothetical protein
LFSLIENFFQSLLSELILIIYSGKILMIKKLFVFICILILTGCRPENRRDAAPDHPNRSKHNADIPEGAKYTIPARKDTGDYPAVSRTRDSAQHTHSDTVHQSASNPRKH